MDEIIAEFLIESYEGLDSLDENLLILEESPDDVPVLGEVFRTLHTIKGACGYLGFSVLERTAHAGESMLSRLRDGKMELTADVADALLATVDRIRLIVAEIDETGSDAGTNSDELVARLTALTEAQQGAGSGPADGQSISEAAPEPAAEADDSDDEFFFDLPSDGPDESASDEPNPEAPESAPDADRIGDILVKTGSAARTDVEIAAAEQQLGDQRKLGAILVDDARAAEADVESAAVSQRTRVSDSTIRVDVGLLNRLMNLVGELVLSRNQIIQLAADDDSLEDFGPAAQRLNLITSELQEGVMKTRMQPINNVWGKLPRVVRDLSHQLGKNVRVEMIGKHTELDRTIIEAIKDPLTHIVRNTVDHGIESPEDRAAAGKDREGVLTLKANHEGGQVNIEIVDDGKGISAEAIKAKALAGGHLTAEQAAAMTDNEIVQLIFEPGFSTASQVSNVSGRGVGMDVVRTNVTKIGGTVEVKTVVGRGTTFKIKIPLTLAIIPALTVTCAGARYAVPQLSVAELVRLDGQDPEARIESLHGAPVFRLRGTLLPVVSMRELLGLATVETDATNIVVLTAGDRRFGLVVDSIEDTEEIVVKPLGNQIKKIRLFSGATIMGDGRIALILDVIGLASEAGLSSAVLAAQADERNSAAEMVDVISDRTLLLIRVGEDDRLAIPMRNVERLEEFPVSSIERSEGRAVVQYRGHIMPLVDLGPASGHLDTAYVDGEQASVVVYSLNGRAAGLAVTEVLDIVSDAETPETVEPGSDAVVIDGRVTDVVDALGLISSRLNIPIIAPPVDPALADVEDEGSDRFNETVSP